MVIYFTGTGNSRYVAEAIADGIGDGIASSNDYIKRGERSSFYSKKPWVFVFPVYVSDIAAIFADFIHDADLRGNKRAYFVATCASYHGIAPNTCYNICREKNLRYMGTSKVNMPQNYIAYFKMMEPDKCREIMAKAVPVIDEITSDIREGKMLGRKLASKGEYDITRLCVRLYNKFFAKSKKFHVTDKCTGCGACAKFCPLNNISIDGTDGRPEWHGKCVHCMACINRCPAQAIEYGNGTKGKPRYVCEKYPG